MNEIEELLTLLTGSDQKKAYQACQQLIKLSEASSIVSAYMEQFIQMMNHPDHSYIRTRGILLIAANAKWDTEHKINTVIHSLLTHIEDPKPITARQCIKVLPQIAKYKPELSDLLLDALHTYKTCYEDSMQSLIYRDRKKAIQQIHALQ